jgi:signal peptidase I
LKLKSWLFLGIFLVVVIGAASFYVTEELKNVDITIRTNGADATISTSSWSGIPGMMITEIKDKTLTDIEDPNSTVESLKNDIISIAKRYNRTADVTIISQFGTDKLPMVAVVKGDSMYPTLTDGQSITVLKTSDIKVNDIVVAFHPQYGIIVKRLSKIDGNRVYLKSDNKNKEIITTQTHLYGNVYQVETIEKTPLNTWLPKENVIGVVKVY